MGSSQYALLVVAGLTLSTTTPAQNITTLIETGAVIPGIGTVIGVNGIAVDNGGHVLVRARTDNPNPAAADCLLNELGVVMAFGGQALAQPSGATIRSFNGGNMTVNSVGRPALSLILDGVPSPEYDSGIYYDLPPILVTQAMSLTTAPQLPVGSLMKSFFYPKINDLDLICVQAVVDDPNIVGLNDTRALFILDPGAGTQNVLAKTGDLLPGQTQVITTFGGSQHELAINNAGQVMYRVNTNSSSSIYLDYTKLSQTGGPYTGFAAVSLNNNGDYAFTTQYGGGAGGIVSNGVTVVEYADTLPDLEPFQLQNIGNPMFLGDDGHLVWCSTFGAPDGTTAKGIFVEYSLLVSTAATPIHGSLVQDLTLQAGSFTLSPSGQYLVFQATLAGGVSGAYLIDLWQ